MLLISVKSGDNRLGTSKEQCFSPSNDPNLSRVKHGVLNLKNAEASFNIHKLSSLFLDLNGVVWDEGDFGANQINVALSTG